MKQSHDELLWALSDGSRTDMEAWDRADVMDFYRGLEIHQARVKRMLKKNQPEEQKPWRS